MKRLITLSVSCLLWVAAHAQKLEVNIHAGTGLYNYTGKGTESTTFVNAGSGNNNAYLNNPYGHKLAFSYQGSFQAKWITAGGFLFGAEAGYQILRSKVDVDRYYFNYYYYGYLPFAAYTGTPAHGSGVLTNQYINLSPYIGYRFKLGQMSLDAMPGLSIGLATRSSEKSKVTIDGSNTTNGDIIINTTDETYKSTYTRTNPKNDIRAGFNIALNVNRWGVTAGYMHGLSDYTSDFIYTTAPGSTNNPYQKRHVYSQLLSLGVFYRLK